MKNALLRLLTKLGLRKEVVALREDLVSAAVRLRAEAEDQIEEVWFTLQNSAEKAREGALQHVSAAESLRDLAAAEAERATEAVILATSAKSLADSLDSVISRTGGAPTDEPAAE